MDVLQHILYDLCGLLYPHLCNACGNSLSPGEKTLCLHCLNDLPYTDYHLYKENKMAKQLWGRIPFDAAMAMLYFKKGGKIQQLIHNLKYHNRQDTGVYLGQKLARRIAESPYFKDIDLVIPVPLHPKKERKRGYNQSSLLVKGIAETLGIKPEMKLLIRKKMRESQTRKSRFTRYENMHDVFLVSDGQHNGSLSGKHVLLVDDVFTTGATLEACGQVLWQAGIRQLSLATLAFTA